MNLSRPDRSARLAALAASYALGTLVGRTRRRLDRIAQTDPTVAAAVRSWEWRLAALTEGMPDMEIPADGAEADGAAEELLLRPLGTVEEEAVAVEDHGDAGHVAVARRRTGARAEEDDADVVHGCVVSTKPETRNQNGIS